MMMPTNDGWMFMVLVLAVLTSVPVNATVDPQCPDEYTGLLWTDKGTEPIVVQVTRSDAPLGADRFYALLQAGFFNDSAIFRVVPDFVIQFGVSGNNALNNRWHEDTITDDPVLLKNKKGTICFAQSNSANSRSSELFINLKDNNHLTTFAAFGVVTSGMDVVDAVADAVDNETSINEYSYIDNGNSWIRSEYPDISFITGSAVSDSTTMASVSTTADRGDTRKIVNHAVTSRPLVPTSSLSSPPSDATDLDHDDLGHDPSGSNSGAVAAIVIIFLLVGASIGIGFWMKRKNQYSVVSTDMTYESDIRTLLQDDEEDSVYPFDIESDDDDSDDYDMSGMPQMPFSSDDPSLFPSDPFGSTSPMGVHS